MKLKWKNLLLTVPALVLAVVLALSPIPVTAADAADFQPDENVDISLDIEPSATLDFDAEMNAFTPEGLDAPRGQSGDSLLEKVNGAPVMGKNVSRAAQSNWWSGFPVIYGKETGTITPGYSNLYRLPPITSNDVLTKRGWSFVLTDMPANADFDLWLYCLTTDQYVAYEIQYGNQTEYFSVAFPQGYESYEYAVIVEPYAGSGSYTIYAGPYWRGVQANGSISSARTYTENVNWQYSWGTFAAPPAPLHNTPTYSSIFTLDLRTNSNIPSNALMVTPRLLGQTVGGTADNLYKYMIFPDASQASAMFDTFPESLNPKFQDSQGRWYSNPVSYVAAKDYWRFRFSVTASRAFTYKGTSFSFGMIFPATPDNLRFIS